MTMMTTSNRSRTWLTTPCVAAGSCPTRGDLRADQVDAGKIVVGGIVAGKVVAGEPVTW
jgi:hypothetical protein